MIQRTLLRQAARATRSAAPRFAGPVIRPVAQPFAQRTAIIARRGYATEGEKKEGEDAAATEASPEEQLKKEVEAKNKEIVDLKDKYMRSIADFRNLQERTKREVQAAKDFALQKFAKDLIESVDNLDHALAMVSEDKLSSEVKNEYLQDLVGLHEGLRMTEKIMLQTLKKHGLERIDPTVGEDKFDPNRHEAMFMAPAPGKEDNSVLMTQRKGWQLNGRTMRAAQVGVVKNS